MNERRFAGGVLTLLGALALLEAWRLSGRREEMVAGAMVGDDTFPLIIGASLFLLGLHTILFARWPVWHVELPERRERRQLVAAGSTLIAYYLVTPYLGYTVSTLLVSTGLFRAMGGYRWPVALVTGIVTTGALFLLFNVWLAVSLPTGWIGI